MIVLGRITTLYDEIEDRISLTGEGPSGEVYHGWLTRKLFDLLLVRLFAILGAGADETYTSVINEFAQDKAEASLSPTVPVTVKTGGQKLPPVLITEIDIAELEAAVQLSFRHSANEGAVVALAHQDLRQWLAIVRAAYVQAQWTMRDWPDWMVERQKAAAARPVLH